MEAKDTVMDINQWLDHTGIDRAYRKNMKITYYKHLKPDLEAQAETTWVIAFKAGKQEGEVARKALQVIEGNLLLDEPQDKRLEFLYRMAHVGLGNCEIHKDWEKELDKAYKQLKRARVI